MAVFVRKKQTVELPYPMPAEYPEYFPKQPLAHGAFPDASINWSYWTAQEYITLEQAIGLLQGYQGNAWCTFAYDSYNKDYIEKLNKVIEIGLGYMLFKKFTMKKAQPFFDFSHGKRPKMVDEKGCLITIKSINENSIVKFKEFVEWAFREGFDIPMPLFEFYKLNQIEDDVRSNDIKINTKLFKTALEQISAADNTTKATIDLSREKDNWYLRRAVTSRLFFELGFSSKQIYRAFCYENEIPQDAVRLSDFWQQKGYEITKQYLSPDNSNLPELLTLSKDSIQPFAEAFSNENENWTTYRGLAAYLLNSKLDFDLPDIYLALSKECRLLA